MRWSVLVVLAAVATGAVGAGVWWTRPAEVRLASVTRGTIAEVVYASGVIEPRNWAKVTSLFRERIVTLCGCEGEEVVAGQVLGRLDDGDQRAALKELEARELFVTAELERTIDLLRRNVVSQQAYDRARTEVAQVQASLAAARAKLDDFVFRSPMSGMVLRSDGAVGEVVEPGQILFWIGRPSPLEVLAEINEEDIPRVAVGQEVELAADAFAGQRFSARVASITPKGDPVAKTYRVRLSLPETTPLRIGMSVEVNIITRTVSDALIAPRAAFDGNRVALVEGDRLRFRTVDVGIRGATRVEVRGGLTPADRIIEPFPLTLADGARVTPTTRAAAP